MNFIYKYLPWAFVGLFAFEILAVFAPKNEKENDFHVREFGRLPVLMNGE